MIFARVQFFNGKTKLVDTTYLFDYVNVDWSKTKLCSQVKDYGDNLIFEGDKLEIYDRVGDVWISGVVLYSQRRAMFLLANPHTHDCNETPLGDLIKDKTFSITGGTDNGEETKTV